MESRSATRRARKNASTADAPTILTSNASAILDSLVSLMELPSICTQSTPTSRQRLLDLLRLQQPLNLQEQSRRMRRMLGLHRGTILREVREGKLRQCADAVLPLQLQWTWRREQGLLPPTNRQMLLSGQQRRQQLRVVQVWVLWGAEKWRRLL
jgi:hypothetical protein